MAVVYVLISIIMVWWAIARDDRPTGPSEPEPVPDDHKQVEELINLTLAVAVQFLVMFLVALWNR
jgi:hypothetical protein